VSLNSHFVSRFLTEPWEFGQRRLRYYDFDTGQFGTQSSRSLFAAIGLNSPEVETRLNRFIETPIASARQRLLRAFGRDTEEDLEWPLFRALALLLLLQPFRAGQRGETHRTLEEWLARPDTEIDELAQSISSRFQLMRVTVAEHWPLFYPSAGCFPLLGQELHGGCALAYAIPLSPRHVAVAVPRDIQWALGPEHWRSNGAGFIANHSIDILSRKVVVHPTTEALQEPALRTAIEEARAAIQQTVALCNESARILREIEALYPTGAA
jgi:hypothetical protein